MQEAGADFITIHGRTRSQMYGGKADWKKIAELKRNVDIPVFANGDVISIETAEQCLEDSQADGIAVGRGVLGDPTLIARIEKYLATGEKIAPPTLEEKINFMKEHLLKEVDFRGENIGIKFVRKFYPYYVNGFQGASKYRGELVMMDNLNEIINEVYYVKESDTEVRYLIGQAILKANPDLVKCVTDGAVDYTNGDVTNIPPELML